MRWSWCESWQRPGPIRTLQVCLIAPAIRPVPVKSGSLKHKGDNAMPVAFVQPETRRLLGCQVVGAKAAEIVNLAATAFRTVLSVTQLAISRWFIQAPQRRLCAACRAVSIDPDYEGWLAIKTPGTSAGGDGSVGISLHRGAGCERDAQMQLPQREPRAACIRDRIPSLQKTRYRS